MSLILYIGFYAVSLISFFVECFTNKRVSFLILPVLVWFLFLIVFRDIERTADTYAYADDFYSITLDRMYNTDNLDTYYQFEIGYSLIAQAVKFAVGENIRLYFLIIALIQILFFFLGTINFIDKYNQTDTRRYSFTFSLLILFLSIFGFMYNGIVLRAGIAISMFYWGTSMMIKKKYFLGVLLCLLTLFIHRTAFLGFFAWLPLVLNITLNRRKAFFCLVFFLILYLLKGHLILSNYISSLLGVQLELIEGVGAQKFSNYLGRVDTGLSSYSVMIIANFILSAYLVLTSKWESSLTRKLLTLNVVSICCLSILSAIPAVTRIFDFFLPYNIVLLFVNLTDVENRKLDRVMLGLIVVVLYATNFYRLAILPY